MKTLIAQTLSNIAIMALFLSVLFLIGYWIYQWGKRCKDRGESIFAYSGYRPHSR